MGRRRLSRGLAGEAIPIEARIICVCDAVNAMTTERPYRAALRLRPPAPSSSSPGTQFDPRVVDALALDLEEARRRGEPAPSTVDAPGAEAPLQQR